MADFFAHPNAAYLVDRENTYSAENALVLALQRGEEEAYEVLLEQFEQPVYSLVYRLVNDPADAGDVLQEVFLKIFRNIGSFREQSSLKTWIYRIAVHESYNHRRWFKRHKQAEVELENPDPDRMSYQEVLMDQTPDPFDETLRREQCELVEEGLKQINPVFRAAVVLRDLEELSYEEISEILRVSMGTVKSRILRGREALRKQLEEKLGSAVPIPSASDATR